MPILKNASGFEDLLRQKGLVEITGPVKRKITEREIEIDKFLCHIYPAYKIVKGNSYQWRPKESIVIHHYKIFVDDEFLGRYRERYDDGVLVKQQYEGGIPGYDFSSDGGHGRVRKNVFLFYLPLSGESSKDFPSIRFP